MIDANFKYKKSRWQDIYAHLKSKGFDTEKDVNVKSVSGYENYRYTQNGVNTNEIAYYNLSQSISSSISINSAIAPYYISTIGIGPNDSSNNLFTRSVFAPIPMETGCQYNIKYTIYRYFCLLLLL